MNAYPLGLPFNTPLLWNMKSSFVIFPYFSNTWMRVYSSTVGERFPTNSRSGLPAADEADEVEAYGLDDGPAEAEADMVLGIR